MQISEASVKKYTKKPVASGLKKAPAIANDSGCFYYFAF
jgi:hypothetical protein